MHAANSKNVITESPASMRADIPTSLPVRALRLLQLAAIAVALTAVGCSGNGIPTCPVEGIVVLENGTPAQTGTVEFNSLERDLTARGSIQSDGTFRLTTFTDGDGAVAGIHNAVVVQLVSTEDLPLHEHDHGPTVDPKYAHYDLAGLQFTVQSDRTNSIRIVVTAVTSGRTSTPET